MTGDVLKYETKTDVTKLKGYGKRGDCINNYPVYIGIELECLTLDDDDHNNKLSNLDYCIPVADGSLNLDIGLEYVFKPETLKEQECNVERFLNASHNALAFNATDEDNYTYQYGLHTHISSHFLSESDKMKIQCFVSKYSTLFITLGGRQLNKHCKSVPMLKLNRFTTRLRQDRELMVNTTNKHTIEYRYAASITSYTHIVRNMQLCHALTMFIAHHCNWCMLANGTALNAFKAYVQANYKRYDKLAKSSFMCVTRTV